MGKKKSQDSVKKGLCVFCGTNDTGEGDFGRLITKNQLSVHYFCMLFSSALTQNGKDDKEGILGFLPDDILIEVKRGTRLRCSFCKKIGATIGCVVSSCRKIFHFGCGRKYNVLNQFCDNYSSYCIDHRPVQTAAQGVGLSVPGSQSASSSTCLICMFPMETDSVHERLHSPCCKNTCYHRSCIQKQAIASGIHFFKCPLCNNKEKFQEEMLQFGIYIPDRDAAWELEPNAFQDLLERHSCCDVPKCLCPHGRNYNKDDSKWEIMLCDLCGSAGTHMACQNIKKLTDDWACHECKGIVKKKERKKTPAKTTPSSVKGNGIADKAKSSYPGKSQPMKRKLPESVLDKTTDESGGKRSCQENESMQFTSNSPLSCSLLQVDSNNDTFTLGTEKQSPHLSLKKTCKKATTPDIKKDTVQSARHVTRRRSCRRTRLSLQSCPVIDNDETNKPEVIDFTGKPAWLKHLMQDDIITGKNLGGKLSDFNRFTPDARELITPDKGRSKYTKSKPADCTITSQAMSTTEPDTNDDCYVTLVEKENKNEEAIDDEIFFKETGQREWEKKVMDRNDGSVGASESASVKIHRKNTAKGGPRSVRLKKLRMKLKDKLNQLENKPETVSIVQSEKGLDKGPTDQVEDERSPPVPWQDFMQAAIMDIYSSGAASDAYIYPNDDQDETLSIADPSDVVEKHTDVRDHNHCISTDLEMTDAPLSYHVISSTGGHQCLTNESTDQHHKTLQDSTEDMVTDCASQSHVLEASEDVVIIEDEHQCTTPQEDQQNNVLSEDAHKSYVKEDTANNTGQLNECSKRDVVKAAHNMDQCINPAHQVELPEPSHFKQRAADFNPLTNLLKRHEQWTSYTATNRCKECDIGAYPECIVISEENTGKPEFDSCLTQTPGGQCESELLEKCSENEVINKTRPIPKCLPLDIPTLPNMTCYSEQSSDVMSSSPENGSDVRCTLPYDSEVRGVAMFNDVSGMVYRMKKGLSKMLPEADYEECTNLWTNQETEGQNVVEKCL